MINEVKGFSNPRTDAIHWLTAIKGKNQDGHSLRLPKKGSHIGAGFTKNTIFKIIEGVSASLSSELGFITAARLLAEKGQDENLAYLPQVEKYKIVGEVNALHWSEDDFFVNEIFNGCNPLSVRVVTDLSQLHPQFFNLEGFDPRECEANELFLTTYPEIKNYIFPAVDNLKKNKVFTMMPEILIAFRKGSAKPELIAIGIHFGEEDF